MPKLDKEEKELLESYEKGHWRSVKGKKGRDLSPTQLTQFLQQHLSKFKIPDQFYYLPEHFSGQLKFNRKTLVELLEDTSVLKEIPN